MRVNIFASLVFAAMVTAGAIPHDHDHHNDHGEDSSSAIPRNALDKRDSYDCKGSSMCSSIRVQNCDDAANFKLIRSGAINYGAPGSGRPLTGACFGYCGIFIQGKPHCARTGDQVWWDYQDIRKRESGNCGKCGTKHWGDGCMTTVNYVWGCSS